MVVNKKIMQSISNPGGNTILAVFLGPESISEEK